MKLYSEWEEGMTRRRLIGVLIVIIILIVAGSAAIFEIRTLYEVNARVDYEVGDYVEYEDTCTAIPDDSYIFRMEILTIDYTSTDEILTYRVTSNDNYSYIENNSINPSYHWAFNNNPSYADPGYRIVGLETYDTKWGPRTVVHWKSSIGNDDSYEYWTFHGLTIAGKHTYMNPIYLTIELRTMIDSNIRELTG
jgi:hypothetical protein